MRVDIRCIMIRDNKIVLCKNLVGSNNGGAPFYFLPGGGLDDGETINECVYRELGEEMGLIPEQIIIDPEIHIIEDMVHIDESKVSPENIQKYGIKNGKFNLIHLLKRVYVNVDKIESKESHISFEEINFSDLPDMDIKSLVIKNYIMKFMRS